MSKIVVARVARENYHFRGKRIPVGRVVKVSESAFEDAQRVRPPYLVAATSAEARAGVAELPAEEPEVAEAPAKPSRK